MKINIRLKEDIEYFTKEMFYLLFEEEENYQTQFDKMQATFLKIANSIGLENPGVIWGRFSECFTVIKEKTLKDAAALVENDPASNTIEEVILAYPGFYAIAIYRLAHQLLLLGTPILPRMMTEYAHTCTGTDINPGAVIGDGFFIDHATGIVIGETVIIKDNVKIYQGVTLGAFHVKKSLSLEKRHPTIEDNVIIYANATILGGETVIGANSTIGGNVWLTQSVPPNSNVFHQSEAIIKPKKITP
ncbi:MAG: serine acetyltransferase [Vicingus serpentipes]|nr:serine acetyltransferase [Vicingus serpentipes]